MIKWYILRVKGGQEEKIQANVEKFICEKNFQDAFREIKVVPYVKGNVKEKKNKANKYAKGSRYLCIAVDIEKYPVVKDLIGEIDGVYGFVGLTGFGGKQEPFPISEREVSEMLKREEIGDKTVHVEHSFLEGQKVKILPLGKKIGVVKKILKANRKLVVVTQLFQQDFTELEVGYAEVERID